MLCIKYHSQSVKGEEGGLLSSSTLRILCNSLLIAHMPGTFPEERLRNRRELRCSIPNQPFPATKGYAYRLPLSGLLQPPVQYSANNFAYASIVALSPDPAQISSNGRKHPDENLSDESFFDEYSEGILAQYIENLDLEDDQEEVSSQDG